MKFVIRKDGNLVKEIAITPSKSARGLAARTNQSTRDIRILEFSTLCAAQEVANVWDLAEIVAITKAMK